jgi:DNA-directed RNA polymerase subunit A"
MMTIYLKKEYNTKEKAKKFATEIRELSVEALVDSAIVDILNYEIELIFNEKRLKENNIKLQEIAEKIENSLKLVTSVEGRKKIVISVEEAEDIKELQRIRNRVLSLVIRGVKGIKQAIVRKEGDDWVIYTFGTNLKKILERKEVDARRTISNDIHEVASVLGIEAARNLIIREVVKTLEEQGLDVDIRHVILVADMMTVDGEVKPIGRYGVAGEKGSVLARANFEETIKHLTNAAYYGEVDRLESTIENVMINQVVPVGTGMVDLVFKPPSGGEEE